MELLGDRHAAEDALADSRHRGRRQAHQVEPGQIAGAEDAAEDGDAERSPGLVDGLHHPRADTAFLLRQFDQRGGHGGGHGDADPEPGDRHPSRHEEAARTDSHRGSEEEPDHEQDEAGGHGHLGAHQAHDPGRGNGSDNESGDQRQQPQPRSHGSRAEHTLEVLRHGEQDAEHGDDREHGEDHPPGERGRGEERQIDQRLAAGPAGQPALPGEETDQQRHSADHHGQGVDIAPAVLAGLDQAVGQDHQPGGRGRHPDEVQAWALRGAGFWHQGDDGDQGHHDDGHIDQEHPAPPVVRQQPTTQDGADREGHEGGRRHDPHGLGSLPLG